MHLIPARHDAFPFLWVPSPAFVEDPQEEANCEVAIIRPVPNEIARAQRVVDVKRIVAANELVEQSAWHATIGTGVLGEKERNDNLPALGIIR